jgi:hypothetical protein
MAVKLVFNRIEQWVDGTGVPRSGAKLFCYVGGSIEVQGVRNFLVLEDGYKFLLAIQSDRRQVNIFLTPAIAAQLVERIEEAQIAASAARMAARDRDTPGWDKPAEGKS